MSFSSSSSSSYQYTMKLLIDTNREKVLFAEASKYAIDSIFRFLYFPIVTVIGVLKEGEIVGGIANLYKSIENLDETYIQRYKHKDVILKSWFVFSVSEIFDLLPSDDDSSCDISATTLFYRCPNHYNHVTCDNRTPCPENCELNMNAKLSLAGGNPNDRFAGGFVKEVVTYMVMDDLVIQPMSSLLILGDTINFWVFRGGQIGLTQTLVRIDLIPYYKVDFKSNSIS